LHINTRAGLLIFKKFFNCFNRVGSAHLKDWSIFFNMKPFADQKKSIEKIESRLNQVDKLLFQLPTGGGKTAIFSFIAQNRHKKEKVLILCHREELVNQTAETLRTIGVPCETIMAQKRNLHNKTNVYVAMVQTLKNRLEANPKFLPNLGLIIIDEAHILLHDKVFNYFQKAKLLAVTATPVTLKKVSFTRCSRCKNDYPTVQICCNLETYEYTRKFTLSELYDEILCGTSIPELIAENRLVRELTYETGTIDRSTLKIDQKTGDYDKKSTDEYYTKHSFDVVKNYEAHALDKKTIIFNSSSTTNQLVLEAFQEAGYGDRVKLFDSVNETENRKKVLKWFKETTNAILLNVNCFTTGFDEPTLECVILNRATKSLSLYHQMVGRGGRVSPNTYKPYFILIDGGGNIQEFGKWSDHVDWTKHFYNNEKPKPKKESLEQTKQCNNCGMIHARTEISCPNCNYEYPKKEIKVIGGEIAVLTDEIPLPNGRKIVNYVEKVDKDKNFAWLVLINQLLDLFIFHSVTFGTYKKTQENGKFEESIRRIIKEPYQTIQNSQLDSGIMRTKAWIINKIKSKLNDYYTRKQNSTTSV